jgi:hypothetical protein
MVGVGCTVGWLLQEAPGVDAFPAIDGHCLSPCGNVTAGLSTFWEAGPGAQLAPGLPAGFPGADGHGTAPRGSTAAEATPAPEGARSLPHKTPAVVSLDGTDGHCVLAELRTVDGLGEAAAPTPPAIAPELAIARATATWRSRQANVCLDDPICSPPSGCLRSAGKAETSS